jgi:hypothetical protein
MADDYELLNVGGLTSLVTNVNVSLWGNEISFECIYDPAGDRSPYTILFHDCRNIRWEVFHPEDVEDLEADLIGIHLGENSHRKAALIHTDIFEISILYGSFSVRKGESFHAKTAELKTEILAPDAPAAV